MDNRLFIKILWQGVVVLFVVRIFVPEMIVAVRKAWTKNILEKKNEEIPNS